MMKEDVNTNEASIIEKVITFILVFVSAFIYFWIFGFNTLSYVFAVFGIPSVGISIIIGVAFVISLFDGWE